MSFLESSIRTFSRPVDRRLLIPAAAIALVAAVFIGVAVGPVYIDLSTVWRSLLGQGEGTTNLIVRDIRLPRVLVGAMVGANLAVAGAILQGVTRNPLADPHVVGISAGAGLVAIAVIVFNPGAPIATIAPLSFAGGMASGGVAYLMAWRGGVSPVRLALAGVAMTAMLTALIAAILVHSSLSGPAALAWLVGGLQGRDWQHFQIIVPYCVLGIVLSIVAARQINIINLGDEIAAGLGQRVERVRLILVALAAMLASSAVSVAGMIGFVGLIVPHLARLTIGNDYRFLIPAAALYGATLLVLADTFARTVFDPRELPVGVLTALIGGPVFIYLIRRRA
jgi:iron complex transport system permease protein